MHADGFHLNPVPAHLYKGRASELPQGQRFRLDHAQVYLYKPEHRSCKNVGASPAVALGYTCAWLSLTNTFQAHLYKFEHRRFRDRNASVDSSSGKLYKPEQRSSENVCASAAVA